MLRVEQRTPTEVVREVKATPSYVAVVGLRGDGEDFLVSEGDRLGNGGGVVVAIYDDRLVVQRRRSARGAVHEPARAGRRHGQRWWQWW